MKDVHFAAFCHFLADLFTILSQLSLQMQQNDIILSTVVSLLEESMVRIECGHPVPGGHLAKFLQMVENGPSFQGVALRGSLEGKSKRGGVMTASLQSEIETAVGLCTKGLSERFDILLQADCQPSSKAPATGHGPKKLSEIC